MQPNRNRKTKKKRKQSTRLRDNQENNIIQENKYKTQIKSAQVIREKTNYTYKHKKRIPRERDRERTIDKRNKKSPNNTLKKREQ